jgi:hypothetical protein
MAETGLSYREQDSRVTEILAITIVSTAFASIVAALRIMTRLHIVKMFGLEDWLILLSCVRIHFIGFSLPEAREARLT